MYSLAVTELAGMKNPRSNGALTIGTGMALGAGLGLIVALISDITIPFGIVMGAAAGLLAMLFSSRRR